jgi:adenylate cyclase
LAEPGGICISRVVRDQIRDKLPYAFEDRGEQNVKNIARPVRVYAWRPEALVGPLALSAPATSPIPQPFVAPRLSIVVLPFANLSNDPEQQYFADGMTDDLTTDLSHLAGMFVISRNTAFTYRNTPVSTKQIGRELGVRYVLEGSVRRLGDRIRVNAQLIDAETEAHLWAERFERELGDLFTLQNEITGRIANALKLKLLEVEAARPADYSDAVDCILRGRAVLMKPVSRDNYVEAIGHYEQALALDPASVDAQSLLAGALAGRVLDQMTDTVPADIERAERLIRQAVAAAPRNPLARVARGLLWNVQNRFDDAIDEFEAALEFNRNWASVFALLGQSKLLTGSLDEAILLQEKAIRLSPRDPYISQFYFRVGVANLLRSRIDEAIVWLKRAQVANDQHPAPHAWLAAAYGVKGETQQAFAELTAARKMSGDDRYSSIARLRSSGMRAPKVRALFEATYFAGLRKAGMPEE